MQNRLGQESLDLDKNHRLRDLKPLKNHKQLDNLEPDDTLVEDLTPLASCTGLRRITLRKASVKSRAALAALTYLESVNVMGTDVTDSLRSREVLPAVQVTKQ